MVEFGISGLVRPINVMSSRTVASPLLPSAYSHSPNENK